MTGGSTNLTTGAVSATSNFDGRHWYPQLPLPSPLCFHQSLAYQGQVVILGGRDTQGKGLNTVLARGILSWHALPPMLESRWQFSAVVYRGEIWALGGKNASHDLASVEAFDGKSWIETIALPKPISAGSSAVFQDTIYHAGGTRAGEATPYASVYRLNLEKGSWDVVASMNRPRSSHGLVVFEGALFAIAGFDGSGGKRSTAVESFNGTVWRSTEGLIQPRSSFATWVAQGVLYVTGGHTGEDKVTNTVITEQFDGNNWTQSTSYPLALNGMAVAVL